MLNKITKTNLVVFMLLAAWVGYYLAVLLKTGFISDDAYNSQIRGRLIQDNITLFTRTFDEALGWVTGAGRFFPLSFYHYALYNVTQNFVLVKLITLTIVLVGVILFYAFVKNETNSRYVGLLAGITVPIFFQFRLWHDPILAFTALIPIIFAYMMGALVLFQKYLDNKKNYLLYLAAFLYLLSLLTYEVVYPFGILFTILAFSRSKDFKQSIKISWPFIFLSVFFVALMVLLRMYFLPHNIIHNAQSTYPGAQLHTDLGGVIQAFKVQIFATLPLSYYFSKKVFLQLLYYKTDLIAVAAFYITTCFLIIKLAKEKVLANPGTLVICGILLLFLPSLEIALSGHQSELIQIGYGFGYIPVYFQYFGLCLICVAALIHICSNLPPKFVMIFALTISALLSTVATINLGLNRAVALETNKFYKYPRQLLESALKAGIVDDIKENSLILRTMRFPSDWTWFYTTATGKKFNVCDINEITAYKKCISNISTIHANDEIIALDTKNTAEILDTSSRDAWILSYTFDKEMGEKGQLFLGKIDHIIQDASSKTPIQIVVKKLRIYQFEENKIYPVDLETRPINFLKIVGNEDGRPSSFQNFSPAKLSAEDTDFQWLGGVLGRDGSDKSNVRWSSGSGKLALYNFSNKPQTIKFSMVLGVPTEEISHLSIKYPEYTETLNLGEKQIPYSKTLSLPPGETMITFASDGKPVANGDPRKIVFGIFDFEFKHLP